MHDTRCVIYDIIKDKEINVPVGKMTEVANQLGIKSYTAICHLISGRRLSILERYVLTENKNRLFVLVDLDTGQEFKCVSPASLFLHLDIRHNENEAKYIYEIVNKRQHAATINGRVFYLKGCKPENIKGPLKQSQSLAIVEMKERKRFQTKIKHALRSRFHYAVVAQLTCKSKKTLDTLGCSVDYFIKYIESKFQPGMTWDNWGRIHPFKKTWNLDHIIACAKFNLFDPAQQAKCFHYTNFQPLWAIDNLRKNAR